MEIYKIDRNEFITDSKCNVLYKIVIANLEMAKRERPEINDGMLGYATEDSKIDDSFISNTTHVINSKLYRCSVSASTITDSELQNCSILDASIWQSNIEMCDVVSSTISNSSIRRKDGGNPERRRYAYSCRINNSKIDTSNIYSSFIFRSNVHDSYICFGNINESVIRTSQLSKGSNDKCDMSITKSTLVNTDLFTASLRLAYVHGDNISSFKNLGTRGRTLYLYDGSLNSDKQKNTLRASTGCFHGTLDELERRLYFKYFLHKPKVFMNYMRVIKIYKSTKKQNTINLENYKKAKVGFFGKVGLILRSVLLSPSQIDLIIYEKRM